MTGGPVVAVLVQLDQPSQAGPGENALVERPGDRLPGRAGLRGRLPPGVPHLFEGPLLLAQTTRERRVQLDDDDDRLVGRRDPLDERQLAIGELGTAHAARRRRGRGREVADDRRPSAPRRHSRDAHVGSGGSTTLTLGPLSLSGNQHPASRCRTARICPNSHRPLSPGRRAPCRSGLGPSPACPVQAARSAARASIAAHTCSATVAASTGSRVSWKSGGGSELPPAATATRSAGRFRSALWIRLGTGPGQSTVTPTSTPTVASSSTSVSESPTTACFEAVYAPLPPPGIGARPAIDAVLTTCPLPCRIRCGTNARMPLTTPSRFTSRVHRQSSGDCSHTGSRGVTMPALLQTTSTRPKSSRV